MLGRLKAKIRLTLHRMGFVFLSKLFACWRPRLLLSLSLLWISSVNTRTALYINIQDKIASTLSEIQMQIWGQTTVVTRFARLLDIRDEFYGRFLLTIPICCCANLYIFWQFCQCLRKLTLLICDTFTAHGNLQQLIQIWSFHILLLHIVVNNWKNRWRDCWTIVESATFLNPH